MATETTLTVEKTHDLDFLSRALDLKLSNLSLYKKMIKSSDQLSAATDSHRLHFVLYPIFSPEYPLVTVKKITKKQIAFSPDPDTSYPDILRVIPGTDNARYTGPFSTKDQDSTSVSYTTLIQSLPFPYAIHIRFLLDLPAGEWTYYIEGKNKPIYLIDPNKGYHAVIASLLCE